MISLFSRPQEALTYEAYKAEAADLPLPLSVRSEQRVLQGALQVLRHVTKNQRAALALLGNYQLAQEEGGGDPQRWMGVDELLQQCKEKWVVSQMEQLRAFITEYRDHDLIRQKTVEGAGAAAPSRWPSVGSVGRELCSARCDVWEAGRALRRRHWRGVASMRAQVGRWS